MAGLKKYIEREDNLYLLKMIINYANIMVIERIISEGHSNLIDHELIQSCAPM